MNLTEPDMTLEHLAARLAALEQENAHLHAKVALLEAGQMAGPMPPGPRRAGADAEPASGQTSRRGLLRSVVGVVGATVGAGALLEVGTDTASANGPTTFTSTTTTPAVTAQGASNGVGVDGSGGTYGVGGTGPNIGLYGTSPGLGVSAYSNGGTGILAGSDGGTAVHAVLYSGTNQKAVFAEAGSAGYAVYATSNSTAGYFSGGSGNGLAASGNANTAAAVSAVNTAGGEGLFAGNFGSGGTGVHAVTRVSTVPTSGVLAGLIADGGPDYGVYATSTGANATIWVQSSGGDGVHAATTGSGANGLYGQSGNGNGVQGLSSSASGVKGVSTSYAGLKGTSSSGYGAYLQGGKAAVYLAPTSTVGHPTSGSHLKGELVVDSTGVLFICTASGSPGTWVKVGAQ